MDHGGISRAAAKFTRSAAAGAGITYGLRRADLSWKPSGRAFCEAAGAKSCPAP